jgi:cold shock CspA family protein
MSWTETVPPPRQDEDGRRISGEMLWFNSSKDFGFIATSAGERLYVAGSAFRNGSRPEGRCAGLVVTFRAADGDETRRAEDVVFVSESAPRRARSRRSGHR